jgi:hypothetical protein
MRHKILRIIIGGREFGNTVINFEFHINMEFLDLLNT